MNTDRKSFVNFIILYIGQTISNLGSSMTSFAVIIWVYKLSGKAMDTSLLAICSSIPYLLVSLLGGAIVDNMNKKKIMLICDSIAAIGTSVIFICYSVNYLQLWIICIVNILSGFMNAFQSPASQVAVTLLIDKKDYIRIGGMQSAISGGVEILKPILATMFLSIGGLKLVLSIDLVTFFVAFITLFLFVKIPDIVEDKEHPSLNQVMESIKEGIKFIRSERAILILLFMYSVLEFMGAISFDSMFSPLLLARTNNNESTVGIVSSFMAIGCLCACILMSILKQCKNKLKTMYKGSYLCLFGITLFGMGREKIWWCIVVFIGCFGSAIYQNYQSSLLREKVDTAMQGRIFSLQGMITGILTPIGYFLGAVLADYIFEPFMKRENAFHNVFGFIVGNGKGSGIGLIFVFAGITGMLILNIVSRNKQLKKLENE